MATNAPLLPITPTAPPAAPNPASPAMVLFPSSSETPDDEVALASERPRAGSSPSRLPLAAAACALLVAVGSAGTWATMNMTAGGVSLEMGSIRGTSGSDGKLTVVLGLLATSVMLLRAWRPARWRWLAWAAPIPFILAALTGGYDWWHLHRIAAVPFLQGTDFTTGVGWGLVVLTLGAAAGGSLALAAAVTRPREARRQEIDRTGESPARPHDGAVTVESPA